jgi:hypothetical protein
VYVASPLPVASNKVLIWKTHFGCQERHNLNLSIISPRDPFAKRIIFWGLVVEEDKKYVLNPLNVALSKGQISLVFWVAVVGDSLRACSLMETYFA